MLDRLRGGGLSWPRRPGRRGARRSHRHQLSHPGGGAAAGRCPGRAHTARRRLRGPERAGAAHRRSALDPRQRARRRIGGAGAASRALGAAGSAIPRDHSGRGCAARLRSAGVVGGSRAAALHAARTPGLSALGVSSRSRHRAPGDVRATGAPTGLLRARGSDRRRRHGAGPGCGELEDRDQPARGSCALRAHRSRSGRPQPVLRTRRRGAGVRRAVPGRQGPHRGTRADAGVLSPPRGTRQGSLLLAERRLDRIRRPGGPAVATLAGAPRRLGARAHRPRRADRDVAHGVPGWAPGRIRHQRAGSAYSSVRAPLRRHGGSDPVLTEYPVW
jgi:hypothetical protein